ncbi:MAG: hypothetical protein Q9217_004912 [Psora testacea]
MSWNATHEENTAEAKQNGQSHISTSPSSHPLDHHHSVTGYALPHKYDDKTGKAVAKFDYSAPLLDRLSFPVMAATPLGIRIAQTIGITSAAFVSGEYRSPAYLTSADERRTGATLCISYLYVPSLLLSPNPLVVRQWNKSFDVGKVVHPGIAMISIIAYGYLAYQMKGTLDQHKAELYGICALSSIMIWPWTMVGMMPTNKKLFRKNDEAAAVSGNEDITEVGLPKGESAKELIDRWSTLNLVRGFMPLVGAVLGVWATVS